MCQLRLTHFFKKKERKERNVRGNRISQKKKQSSFWASFESKLCLVRINTGRDPRGPGGEKKKGRDADALFKRWITNYLRIILRTVKEFPDSADKSVVDDGLTSRHVVSINLP